jgi:hypothetical protein
LGLKKARAGSGKRRRPRLFPTPAFQPRAEDRAPIKAHIQIRHENRDRYMSARLLTQAAMPARAALAALEAWRRKLDAPDVCRDADPLDELERALARLGRHAYALPFLS